MATNFFQRSAEHIRLSRYLTNFSIGDCVLFTDIDALVGTDASQNGLLYRVRRALEQERYFFVPDERGKSIKRVDDKQFADYIGPRECKGIYRKASRGRKRLELVVAEELSTEDRQRLAMHQTILGFHETLGTRKTQKKIEEITINDNAAKESLRRFLEGL